jgi:uncharacterized membrane protein YebE (DUF533 family)
MIPEMLIDGVLSSVLGGRPKRSFGASRFLSGGGGLWSNPQVLMTAAGLAWGVYETMQNGQPQTPGGQPAPSQGAWWPPSPTAAGGSGVTPAPGASGAETTTPPPIPRPITNAGSPPASEDAVRIARLAISAANADGAISEQERAAVIRQATTAGVGDIVEREMQNPRPLREIVQGVTDPAAAATLYVLAFTILRADEQVTGAERIYLAQLANLLHLDADAVQALEKNTGERIDALGDQGQLGG